MDDGGTLAVSAGGKATDVTMTSGSALIADSGATVEGTNASGKFSIDGTSGQASGLLLEMAAALRLMPEDWPATPLSDIVEH